MVNIIAKAKADKPQTGAPCNGCGYCCMKEVCGIGKMVFGDSIPAPCPGLFKKTDEDRYYYSIVMAEKDAGLEEKIAKSLAIGWGCDSD